MPAKLPTALLGHATLAFGFVRTNPTHPGGGSASPPRLSILTRYNSGVSIHYRDDGRLQRRVSRPAVLHGDVRTRQARLRGLRDDLLGVLLGKLSTS